MDISFTKEFACPPARLWLFLDEPERLKQWLSGLEEMRHVKEESGRVGTTFVMKIKEGRKVSEYEGQVTAYETERHLGISFWGGNFPPGMVMHVDYRLADLGGRTRLDYVAKMTCSQPLPWWLRLLIPLGKLFGRFQLKAFMKRLQQLAERPD